MAVPLLAWGLAGLVGLGSVILYLAAFFFPEVHRRHDFFWSGVGCFYALILWLDAGQVSPTELVGHVASISLMGWLGWQTLTLRRKRTPLAQQTPYTADSWPTFRREMTVLALDVLRQTPLRRWLPIPSPAPASVSTIRMSALKEVGYEFVDPVEGPEAPPTAKLLGGPEKTMVSAPTSTPLSSSTPPSSPRSAAPKPQTLNKGMTLGQRVQGLATWVQDVVQAKNAPQPKKPVIEIPPRPSSLAKRSAGSAASTPTVPPPSAPPTQPTEAAEQSPSATVQPPTSAASSPSPSPEASNWDDDDGDWI